MEEVRSYIKTWEHDFQRAHGKVPSKEDIKKDAVIRMKYKQYSLYKQGKPEKANKIKVPQLYPSTPSKRRILQLTTPQKTSPSSPFNNGHGNLGGSPSIVTELGPTPQLNGRVLSIFEILRSPQKSPLKKITAAANDGFEAESPDNPSGFKTPTKKKLNFNMKDKSINNLGNLRTPSKTPKKHIEETPAYFNEETPYNTASVSPSKRPVSNSFDAVHSYDDDQTSLESHSPLFKKVKPISKLIRELDDIKDDLKYGDYDLEELIPARESSVLSTLSKLTEDDSDEEQESVDENGEFIQKQPWERKVKRQTRRVNMRARPMEGTDMFEDDEDTLQSSQNSRLWSNALNLRLHQVSSESLPKSLQPALKNAIETKEQDIDENDEWPEEVPYIKNTVQYERNKKRVYSNFKCMRINKPRHGRFDKRR